MKKLRELSSLKVDLNRQRHSGINFKVIVRLCGKNFNSMRTTRKLFKIKQGLILRWRSNKNQRGMNRNLMAWNKDFMKLSAKILNCKNN
jgi:hypothetical protein